MNQRISRRTRPRCLSAILVLATVTSPARGEEKPASERVRVTVVSTEFTGTRVGTIVKSGQDHLSLLDSSTRLVTELPLDAIVKIEVQRERRATKKGLYLGLGVGSVLAILGAALADSLDSPCVRYPANSGPVAAAYNRECDSQEAGTRLGIAGLLVTPTAIGAGVGYLSRRRTWSDAPLERFKARIQPERSGGRVGLSWSF